MFLGTSLRGSIVEVIAPGDYERVKANSYVGRDETQFPIALALKVRKDGRCYQSIKQDLRWAVEQVKPGLYTGKTGPTITGSKAGEERPVAQALDNGNFVYIALYKTDIDGLDPQQVQKKLEERLSY